MDEGVKKNSFSATIAKQMLPVKPKPGSFYLLPKVHKKFDRIPKGRPIIPGCGSNTEILSWFCDQAVKDKVKEMESRKTNSIKIKEAPNKVVYAKRSVKESKDLKEKRTTLKGSVFKLGDCV